MVLLSLGAFSPSSYVEQEALTQRALELLALPDDDQVKLLLDVGCGSGLSGQALTEKGHVWMVSPPAAATTACSNLHLGGACSCMTQFQHCMGVFTRCLI